MFWGSQQRSKIILGTNICIKMGWEWKRTDLWGPLLQDEEISTAMSLEQTQNHQLGGFHTTLQKFLCVDPTRVQECPAWFNANTWINHTDNSESAASIPLGTSKVQSLREELYNTLQCDQLCWFKQKSSEGNLNLWIFLNQLISFQEEEGRFVPPLFYS